MSFFGITVGLVYGDFYRWGFGCKVADQVWFAGVRYRLCCRKLVKRSCYFYHFYPVLASDTDFRKVQA